MRKTLTSFIFSVIIFTLLFNCANRGTISGGEKDTTPPVIVRSVPENFSTNFNEKEIRVYFDEYVKIKDLQKQLIISPPMNNTPEVTPLGGASKFIKIKILDTLQPNTTYAFNFGESIVDNNEENPYPYYRYVFSTGDYIDSLNVKGIITDALKKETDEFVSVLLYEVDSTYNDSIIYKEKPKYVSNTLDSTAFSIDNLKPGKYLLTALKENNNNYTFQPKTDKIGFINEFITVPSDTTYTIKLFNEILDFKATRPSYISEGKIAFGYEGNPDNLELNIISSTPNNFKNRIVKETDKDTLNYWFSPKMEVDSLLFQVKNNTYTDTLTVRVIERDKDSLIFSTVGPRVLKIPDVFKITANIPIENTIDISKVTIIDRDSLVIPHTVSFDELNNVASFSFEKKEDNAYSIQMLPGTFTDFFGTKNDTLNYRANTRPLLDYADLRVNLVNAIYPVIVQLTDNNGEVKFEKYLTEAGSADFKYVDPGIYYLRVVFDTNKNGVYDTGNFLLKQQPERVSHAEGEIEVIAYADKIITFPLKKE
ncbi:hypothetical protein D7030_07820 [Flavobacteriaceae bacterium AU392]|nr:hypothetical protein D1817_00595 [Flavobacteriaceae bacterium]RKM85030.1 hypothetical protein D7030_07820 [Flavobacteriaceae bacterium AU392]